MNKYEEWVSAMKYDSTLEARNWRDAEVLRGQYELEKLINWRLYSDRPK